MANEWLSEWILQSKLEMLTHWGILYPPPIFGIFWPTPFPPYLDMDGPLINLIKLKIVLFMTTSMIYFVFKHILVYSGKRQPDKQTYQNIAKTFFLNPIKVGPSYQRLRLVELLEFFFFAYWIKNILSA